MNKTTPTLSEPITNMKSFLRPQDLMVPQNEESTIGIDGEAPHSEIPILTAVLNSHEMSATGLGMGLNNEISVDHMGSCSPIAESVETNSDEEGSC